MSRRQIAWHVLVNVARGSARPQTSAATPQRLLFILIAALAVALLVASIAVAQSGSGYDLSWSVIAGGGGSSRGSGHTLDGTLGQFDAGMLSGGGYTLSGGFWTELTPLTSSFSVYLPLILK